MRTTCPRDCYDACGVLVTIRDGRLRHVRGDPEHHVSRGKLCAKCSIAYNGVLRDPEARLTRPLRRSGPKGAGRFEPVSWDEAVGEIAARLGEIVVAHGSKTVLNAHYTGTCALVGTAFPQRFFHRLGATEVDPDTICNKAGHEALSYLYGSSGDGFDPETAVDSSCILVWGANPSASAPHQHEHWLAEAAATVVVVDPVPTPTAAAADLHLQPFPGSDAALAFALGHVMQRDGLLDRAFIDAHTRGSTSWSRCSLPAPPPGERRLRVCRPRPSSTPPGSTRQARPSSGSARASSVSRGAATPCGPWRCCRR